MDTTKAIPLWMEETCFKVKYQIHLSREEGQLLALSYIWIYCNLIDCSSTLGYLFPSFSIIINNSARVSWHECRYFCRVDAWKQDCWVKRHMHLNVKHSQIALQNGFLDSYSCTSMPPPSPSLNTKNHFSLLILILFPFPYLWLLVSLNMVLCLLTVFPFWWTVCSRPLLIFLLDSLSFAYLVHFVLSVFLGILKLSLLIDYYRQIEKLLILVCWHPFWTFFLILMVLQLIITPFLGRAAYHLQISLL